MNQTAIQLLRESIDSEMKLGTKMVVNWGMYLEMEQDQIIDAHIEGQRLFDKHPHTQWTNDQAIQYYIETYGKDSTGI